MNVATLCESESKYFDTDLLIQRLAGWPAVDLHADETCLFDALVGFGVVDRLGAVEPDLYPTSFATDHVIIPVIELNKLDPLFLVRGGPPALCGDVTRRRACPTIARPCRLGSRSSRDDSECVGYEFEYRRWRPVQPTSL